MKFELLRFDVFDIKLFRTVITTQKMVLHQLTDEMYLLTSILSALENLIGWVLSCYYNGARARIFIWETTAFPDNLKNSRLEKSVL